MLTIEPFNLSLFISQLKQNKQCKTLFTFPPENTDKTNHFSGLNKKFIKSKNRYSKYNDNGSEDHSDNSEETNIIGAGCLIFDIITNRILVVKGPSKWSLPKGHLDPGETPREAAIRETFEETSLLIEINPQCKSKKLKKCIYYYIILENAHQLMLTPIDKSEISEVRWCTYDELLTINCNRQLQYFIDRWKFIIKIFYNEQTTLSIRGSVPTPEEHKTLSIEITKEHQLYDQLYGTPRHGIGKADEDDNDNDDSNSDNEQIKIVNTTETPF